MRRPRLRTSPAATYAPGGSGVRGRRGSGACRAGSPAGEHVVRVDDRVGVALLGQEALAVRGVLLVEGVAADDAVEVGGPAVLLRAQDAAQALGLLLPAAEGAGDLDRHRRLGQVDGE